MTLSLTIFCKKPRVGSGSELLFRIRIRVINSDQKNWFRWIWIGNTNFLYNVIFWSCEERQPALPPALNSESVPVQDQLLYTPYQFAYKRKTNLAAWYGIFPLPPVPRPISHHSPEFCRPFQWGADGWPDSAPGGPETRWVSALSLLYHHCPWPPVLTSVLFTTTLFFLQFNSWTSLFIIWKVEGYKKLQNEPLYFFVGN